jgi:hypothetical protein
MSTSTPPYRRRGDRASTAYDLYGLTEEEIKIVEESTR